jgi:hypothetical protein
MLFPSIPDSSIEDDYRVKRITAFFSNEQNGLLSAPFHFDWCAVMKQACRSYRVWYAINCDLIAEAVQYMDVMGVSIRRAHAYGSGWDHARPCAIDGLPVDAQPFANAPQSRRLRS